MGSLSGSSSDDSECELNDETLDALYVEQLQFLRDLILKQSCADTIELCGKWLRIFSKTTETEKLARNCLCALMQEQLNEAGYLDKPFTNLQNCNRDLDQVLHEMDMQNSNEGANTEGTRLSDIECLSISRTISTQMIPEIEDLATDRDILLKEMTCQENELQIENAQLRHELESLRLMLTEKEIENSKLREQVDNSSIDNENKEEENVQSLDQIKLIMYSAISQTLQNFHAASTLKYPLFENLFRYFCDTDADFSSSIKKYDELYKNFLHGIVDRQHKELRRALACQIAKRLSKTKLKLRKRYDRRLRIQNWAQRVQIKLVKLKCFSSLRRIFIETQQNNTTVNMWDVLRALEEKYQSAVNDIA